MAAGKGLLLSGSERRPFQDSGLGYPAWPSSSRPLSLPLAASCSSTEASPEPQQKASEGMNGKDIPGNRLALATDEVPEWGKCPRTPPKELLRKVWRSLILGELAFLYPREGRALWLTWCNELAEVI